jgi:hypothetical protein
MKNLLALLLMALAACIPQTPQSGYSLTDIGLLFPDGSERWSYFYGDPQALRLETRTIALTQNSQTGIWVVKDALWADGQPNWREVGTALRPPAGKLVRGFPLGRLILTPERDIRHAWLYDGQWFRLSAAAVAGKALSLDSRDLERNNPDLEDLTSTEEEVVLREVLARRGNRPVVIFELERNPFNAYRLEPAPQRYNRAAIGVQYGIETEVVLVNPDPGIETKSLSQGGQASYNAEGARAYLVNNQTELRGLWNLVAGNILPTPQPPEVNFSRSSVVAFFWGIKNSGGYSLRHVRTEVQGGTARITLQLSSPAPGAITTQALTSPFLVLELTGKVSRVQFVDTAGRSLGEAGN